MQALSIKSGRILLRDFTEADRAAFIEYQTDPRYLRLYDFDQQTERPTKLFDLFLQWQRDRPRMNMQLAICEVRTGRLLGCGGLRKVDDTVAVLGIELAPSEWGRFRVALDASGALVRYGFETLNLGAIIGDTASGNRRVEKLARWFGAEIVARRMGPDWMQARGWQEVDWAITRESWQRAGPPPPGS
ncbi:GNAT family N-acetyltransferase [Belnapia sp. T18]|uniref:GNAT family N-acetyltransferase n=1 Tax=Belnapia arida TaxID=2804533 RepID=A0ABS1UCF4_9PROT|nr:GNAT family N-acetyltransferase [Belnapia arida]MBL6082368.1 GNAT family N-acetyltransferase [Belnapia arida]